MSVIPAAKRYLIRRTLGVLGRPNVYRGVKMSAEQRSWWARTCFKFFTLYSPQGTTRPGTTRVRGAPQRDNIPFTVLMYHTLVAEDARLLGRHMALDISLRRYNFFSLTLNSRGSYRP